MKMIIQIVGIIALLFAAYWMFVVIPARKDCVKNAEQLFSQSSTNYIQGLIQNDIYEYEKSVLDVRLKACFE